MSLNQYTGNEHPCCSSLSIAISRKYIVIILLAATSQKNTLWLCAARSDTHRVKYLQDGKQKRLRCHVDDELLLEILQQEGLPKTTRIFLVYDSSLDDARANTYPMICTTFTCVTIKDYWNASHSTLEYAESAVVHSYLSLLLAKQAEIFYGNRFSLLAGDVSLTLEGTKGSVNFYNPEM